MVQQSTRNHARERGTSREMNGRLTPTVSGYLSCKNARLGNQKTYGHRWAQRWATNHSLTAPPVKIESSHLVIFQSNWTIVFETNTHNEFTTYN